MTEKRVLLSVRDLKKYFPIGGSPFKKGKLLRANDGVSMDIYEGETFGLVGESGSGKSTFGRTLLQLLPPTSGSVRYFGSGEDVELTTLPKKRLRSLRKELQIIFQDPYSSLNPRMTVGRLIEEGVRIHGDFKEKRTRWEYVLETLKKCGLDEYAAGRYPHQFSGGQRQRVAIARALAVKPKFIVCDECVSALDVSIQAQILNLLADLREREKLTYLFISHDLSVVRHLSDRIGVMYLGKLVEWGNAEDVFSAPAHPYTRALISASPTIEAGEKREEILLSGNPPSAVSPPSGCPFHPRCFMAQECCKRIPAPLRELQNGRFVACHFAEEGSFVRKNR